MGCNILLVLVFACFICSLQGWSHMDQDKWPEKFCKKGIAQSPIDIKDGDDVVDRKTKPFKLKNFDVEQNVTLLNTADWVWITFDGKERILVSGAGLPGVYVLDSFALQWPSQHTLNGERKAMEGHFAMYNVAFKSWKEAIEYKLGFAISAILYELDDKDNPALQPIVDKLDSIKNAKTSVKMKLKPSILLPKDMTEMFRYVGSRTLPNCQEGVIWSIFPNTEKVSKNQLDKFKTLLGKDGKPIKQGYRKIQKLNSRTVYKIAAS